MDKQREIYRQLLVNLFEKNFTSALFEEKTDAMMKVCDFEMIRNEIEEETFTKNRGIKPYIDAIKYLCKKIEKCTADNELFEPIEDYICAKENIVVTKIEKVASKVPVKTYPAKKKIPKGTTKTEATVGHAGCISPNPCKKCRFMRRLDRPKTKSTKRGKKTATQTSTVENMAQVVQEVKPEVVLEIKTEVKMIVNEPDYPNYMESIESVINASKNVMKPKSTPLAQSATVSNQLPYHDHQYSRITFYGSGNTTETNAQKETAAKEEKPPAQQKVVSVRKQKNDKVPIEKKPRQKSQRVVPRSKSKNGLQQSRSAYFVPSSIASTTSTYTVCQPTPAVVRPIPKPRPSIYVNGTNGPLQFRAPIAFVPGPVIQQPIYYLLCNPQK